MGFAAELLTSLGGATVILYALSKWLGNVWADRIAKQTLHKFNVELQQLKREGEITLEQTRALNQLSMQDRQSFSEISQKTYQEFFEKRLSVYKQLLHVRHKYLASSAHFAVEELEMWGDQFVRYYEELRVIVGEHELYLSAKLDESFDALRRLYDDGAKDRDLRIAYASGQTDPEMESALNNTIYGNTYEAYGRFEKQLLEDVRSLRSRIDLDRA